MKICFLIADASRGSGTEKVTSDIANGLQKKGYNISILSFRNGETSTIFKFSDKIKIFSLHAEKRKNPVLRKLINFINVTKFLRQNKVDIAIAVDTYIYPYLLLAQIKKYCKCVSWEHFNFHVSNVRTAMLGRYLSVKFANKVIVLGKNDYNSFIEHYGKLDKITYIYNILTCKIEKNNNIHKHRIIAAGRLTKQKGFDLLIAAWAKIESSCPDWRLDIFGDGELKKQLDDQIKRNKLKNVNIRGYTKTLDKEMMNSSIFVLPSRYEGFVMVLLEAQAKGLPCVSFDCKEGPSEIIEEGVNGYLVNSGDITMLATRILQLIKDEKLRIQFSENSQKGLARFLPESVLSNWEEMFREL